jgi:RNA polymerase sigma factor (sigma-70 family)
MDSLAHLWKECVQAPHDNSVWQRLLDSQKAVFARIIVRVGNRFDVGARNELDDAMQEVCMKLSAMAREKAVPQLDDSHLEAYLRASVANAGHDYFRARHARRRDTGSTVSLEDMASLQPCTEDQFVDREILIGQIEQMVKGQPRDREIFLLHFRLGLTSREISTISRIGLTQKGVESVIHRLIEGLRGGLNQPGK